jgi:DNA-binding MarR family transcriptional regulator
MTMLASPPAPSVRLTPIQRQRLTPLQRDVFDLISERGSISYTDIAAELYIARMSAMTAIRQLELEQLIEKVVGHGRMPNRYVVKEPQP